MYAMHDHKYQFILMSNCDAQFLQQQLDKPIGIGVTFILQLQYTLLS